MPTIKAIVAGEMSRSPKDTAKKSNLNFLERLDVNAEVAFIYPNYKRYSLPNNKTNCEDLI